MARVRYFVVLQEGEWKIKSGHEHSGPYDTQRDAIRAAVHAAHEAGKRGKDAQVIVQGTDHRFRTEWTYGHDPYPPRG
jgi:hypothetical protein